MVDGLDVQLDTKQLDRNIVVACSSLEDKLRAELAPRGAPMPSPELLVAKLEEAWQKEAGQLQV